MKKGVLRNFTKFTGKRLCQSLFFNKAAGHSCFPVNFAKFLRIPLGDCFCKENNVPNLINFLKYQRVVSH